MYNLIISLLPLIFLLIYVKDDPNTIQGNIKIFFQDIAQYLKFRIMNAMKNKFIFLYFIYCLFIHIIYIYILSNKFNERNNIEQEKSDNLYYILFYIMIICATLIENNENYGKFLSYDYIPFFLSNLIWLFYMIIKTIIKIVNVVKNHGFEITNNVFKDFKNFKISSSQLLSNIFYLPFQIVFNSYSIIKSESNLPVPLNYVSNLPTSITSSFKSIYNLASSTFSHLNSGLSKVFFYGKNTYDFYKLDNIEKFKVVQNYLFYRDKKNFLFLLINSLNFILVILSIIILIIHKLITNFINFRKEIHKKRKY